MRQALILLLASLFIIGFADATLKENINPGKATVELGSYEMSFSLPDDVESYDIQTTPTSNEIFKNSGYDVYIKEADAEGALLTIMFWIWQEPQIFPIYEEVSRTDLGEFGTSVTIPLEIDGSEGHVVYNYPEGDPSIDPLKAYGAGFKYYPRAQSKGEDLEGIYEVSSDTFGAAMEDSRVMPIFQEVMRTIHLSGI
jgi:hypothetical protein